MTSLLPSFLQPQIISIFSPFRIHSPPARCPKFHPIMASSRSPQSSYLKSGAGLDEVPQEWFLECGSSCSEDLWAKETSNLCPPHSVYNVRQGNHNRYLPSKWGKEEAHHWFIATLNLARCMLPVPDSWEISSVLFGSTLCEFEASFLSHKKCTRCTVV